MLVVAVMLVVVVPVVVRSLLQHSVRGICEEGLCSRAQIHLRNCVLLGVESGIHSLSVGLLGSLDIGEDGAVVASHPTMGVNGVTDRLADRLVDRLAGRLVDRLVGGVHGHIGDDWTWHLKNTSRLAGRLVDRLVGGVHGHIGDDWTWHLKNTSRLVGRFVDGIHWHFGDGWTWHLKNASQLFHSMMPVGPAGRVLRCFAQVKLGNADSLDHDDL